jgi:phage FluMu protein Com
MSDEMAPTNEEEPMNDAEDSGGADAAVLDGNALAGLLAAAFGSEMTTIPGRCAHCGRIHVVAEMRAYIRAPGAILRCPSCDGVVIRIVETPEATYIDARGAAFLRFERR